MDITEMWTASGSDQGAGGTLTAISVDFIINPLY